MTRYEPEEIIEAAEREQAAIREHYLPAVEWFLDNQGMGLRREVVADLADHLGVEHDVANAVVGHLVSDDADPVQQVVQPQGGKYVGVIDHAEHEWFYAFDRYDDVEGRQRRAVCAHCVHTERSAADVAHFTRPPEEYDLDRARGALALHYQVDHDGRALADVLAEDLDVDPTAFARRVGLPGPGALSLREVTRRLDTDLGLADAAARLSVPEVDVEPGASLVSGTTIGGNTAWHAGNDGSGSGLDADTVDGKQATELCCFIQRDPSGNAYIQNTTSTYAGSIIASVGSVNDTEYYTNTTLTPTNSWDAGFLSYTVSANGTSNLTISTLSRNGSPVSPETTGVIVSGITTGDTFYFRFHNTDFQTGKIYASLKAAKVL